MEQGQSTCLLIRILSSLTHNRIPPLVTNQANHYYFWSYVFEPGLSLDLVNKSICSQLIRLIGQINNVSII